MDMAQKRLGLRVSYRARACGCYLALFFPDTLKLGLLISPRKRAQIEPVILKTAFRRRTYGSVNDRGARGVLAAGHFAWGAEERKPHDQESSRSGSGGEVRASPRSRFQKRDGT